MPNPFYQCYAGAALAAGRNRFIWMRRARNGFLPDLDALSPELLSRTALFYLCSPANPQGSVADLAYLKRLVQLARTHDFVLALDECYARSITQSPPPGGFSMQRTGRRWRAGAFRQCAGVSFAFQTLEPAGPAQRLCRGRHRLISRFRNFRSYIGPTNPLPADAAAAAAWSDEAHVSENRRLYAQKFDAADEILAGRFGYARPAGGFFLWLDVGDGEAAALKLWREAGVKVLPGKYLARGAVGDPYIRVALVGPLDETIEGLRRIRRTLEAEDKMRQSGMTRMQGLSMAQPRRLLPDGE